MFVWNNRDTCRVAHRTTAAEELLRCVIHVVIRCPCLQRCMAPSTSGTSPLSFLNVDDTVSADTASAATPLFSKCTAAACAVVVDGEDRSSVFTLRKGHWLIRKASSRENVTSNIPRLLIWIVLLLLHPNLLSSFAFCPIYSTSRRTQPGTVRHSKQIDVSFMGKEVDIMASIALVDSNTDNQACETSETKREDTKSPSTMLQCQPTKEWVLTVPPRLTQVALEILLQANCAPQPWHLEGRNGSRTHRHNHERMGIPIWSADHVLQASHTVTALRDLLHTTDEQGNRIVEMIYKEYTISNRRPHEPPPHDARIHPERAPTKEIAAAIASTAAATTSVPAFTYAELFAGIGGFGVALEALGGECVFCSELEEACRDMYTANLKVANENLHGDIYKVADADLPANLDLLVGGFPCQPFSAMGEQPGLECEKGNLFTEIVRVLKVSKPKAFLLENVPGLLQMKDTLHTIVAALEDAGYTVCMEVCDARGLTATSRKRLYLVGLWKNDSNNEVFEFPYVPDLSLRAGDVIQYEPLMKSQEELLRVTGPQLERLNAEPYWRPSHLAWPNYICNTLVSHYGKSVARGHSQLVPASGTNMDTAVSANPRRFTPRECARIMGFPESYVLPEKKREDQGEMARTKELYRMLGNAVCPPMIAAIAGAVLDRAIPQDTHTTDWVERGRATAIRLAYEATITKSGN
jgi:DNA (cytosine-5)-methyltransferase 1